MVEASKLIGSKVKAKVTLHRYRHPQNRVPLSGEWVIVTLDVEQVIEGVIPFEAYTRDGTIILKGNMPRLEEGMEYMFTGTLVCDKDWGYQYDCDIIHLSYDMSSRSDQEKFFSFFMTEKQIEALFDMYDNPVEFLESKDLGALTKVKGIGPATANRMCLKYAENINNSRAYIELKGMDITKNAIDKLVLQFGSADVVVDIIKKNPYALIKLVKGYGWEKADRLALQNGFKRDSKERCLARAEYEMDVQADFGSSCMFLQELLDLVTKECAPASPADIANWIKENTVSQKGFDELLVRIIRGEKDVPAPTFFYDRETKRIGLFKYRLLEKQIVQEFERLTNASSYIKFDKSVCESIIKEVEAEQGYTYTHEQRKAIWNALENNVSILTGSSGTGKSSTLKPLIRIFERYSCYVEQCALSGRAASLLTEYTGLTGKTIHRLLTYVPDQERFAHNYKNPLAADVIILDETSMVGEELFYCLISAIKTGAKLIMLGDIKQLPPMSVGNLLNDCIQSGYIPTVVLTIIQRQALKSGIIAQSIHVCEGKSIVKNDFAGEEIRGELCDFKISCNSDIPVVHNKIIDEFKHLHFDQKISADDIQIIVPTKSKGVNSCRTLNAEIQKLVNPGKPGSKSETIQFKEGAQLVTITYRPGDKIMIIKNNYHARSLSGREVAIFNGNMGHIVDIDNETMIVDLDEQGRIILNRDEWLTIIHSWACTCHKLQGSQAPYVVVGLDYGGFSLLNREWLYTALTRARKYCALVGQPKAINLASRTSDIKIKQTWLKNDLYNLFLAKVGA